MATKTSLLGLTKPAYTDAADIAVLNGNFDLIDKAVGNGARVVNLLDNSWFVNPINQRGETSYQGIGYKKYTIDRWLTWCNEDVTISVTKEGVVIPSGGHLIQTVNPDFIKIGSHYTMAAKKSDGSLLVANGVGGQGFGNIDSVVGEWLSDLKTYNVYLYGGAYEWVALYEGEYTADTLPLYQPKGYAAELAECQRYYFTMPNDPFANGQTIGAGNAMMFSIQTPVAMRVNEPTLDLHGGSLTIRCNGADYPVTAVSQQGKTGCFVSFMAQA